MSWKKKMSRLRVAIGEQLKSCPQVITLGERPQMADYTERERRLLCGADTIFFPTARFVDIFATLGKETFPSINCYRLRGNRLKHTILFRLLDVAHPRTRVYYGHKQKAKILKDFVFPFIAKEVMRTSDSNNIFLIDDREKLDTYNRSCNPAYIQEYVAGEQELRVVVLNHSKVFGYWRAAVGDDLRGNHSRDEGWKMDEVSPEATSLAKHSARAAGLSYVAVDMIFDGSRLWVLELNFQYEKIGDFHPGKDGVKMITEMIEKGEL
jgi:ribosomal protein S6--L-glutamate ligase